MNCEKISELLPAFLDHELGKTNQDQVRSHLESCQACQNELAALKVSWEVLGELESLSPSTNFEARFWAKLRQEESKLAGWRSWFQPRPLIPVALGFAGMVLVWVIGVTGGLMLFRNHNAGTSSSLNPSSIFTAPYPQNSIEQIFMEDQTTMKGRNL